MYNITESEFLEHSLNYNVIPIYREVMADLETPVSAYIKMEGGGDAFLLESVEGGEKWARYSFIGKGDAYRIIGHGRSLQVKSRSGEEEFEVDNPLDYLKDLMARFRQLTDPGIPRFSGGLVGYLSYDIVRFFERLPARTIDDLKVPDIYLVIPEIMLMFDALRHKIIVLSNAMPADGEDPLETYKRCIKNIEDAVTSLKGPLRYESNKGGGALAGDIEYETDKERFLEMVDKTRGYVIDGDIIQAVISQRIRLKCNIKPFDIYRALRVINPSPYMFYLKFKDLKLIGSSPEVLVRVVGETIELRPIAGTRPRGQDEVEDKRLEEELLKDPKERAEHVMLVDLGRNDVGRVAHMGKVHVSDFMAIERYSHVMHIVSNIRGDLAEDRDIFDVFRACFPAGTVTGAPKIRAMEIIEELESRRRGVYAGAVGYFGFGGNMDMCITIRTILKRGDYIYVQAGAGIVADSVPEREYEETLSKARALLKAVEMASSL